MLTSVKPALEKYCRVLFRRIAIAIDLRFHDPRDLGYLICLAKKRKIRFRILSNLRILHFLKETHR